MVRENLWFLVWHLASLTRLEMETQLDSEADGWQAMCYTISFEICSYVLTGNLSGNMD